MSERVLDLQSDFEHLPKPNELSIVLTDEMPPVEQVTAAFVLAFDGDRLLMTDERGRGWNIVGGGVEPGETPEQAARRETVEEAAARLGALKVLGYQRVRLLCPKPDGYRHPYPDSYMLLYWARVEALDELVPNDDVAGRALVPPDEVPATFWGGFPANRRLHEAALARARAG